MVLTMAGIVVKILGGLNRILLSRLLGGEGIGLYQDRKSTRLNSSH